MRRCVQALLWALSSNMGAAQQVSHPVPVSHTHHSHNLNHSAIAQQEWLIMQGGRWYSPAKVVYMRRHAGIRHGAGEIA